MTCRWLDMGVAGTMRPLAACRIAACLTVAAVVVGCGRAAPASTLSSAARLSPTFGQATPLAPVASSARTTFSCDPETNAPTRRAAPSVAYDPDSRQVLLFGGTANTESGYCDTWSWTGIGWTRLHPAHHPSGRSFAYMAFDYRAKRMLLYGGGTYLNDPGKYDAWSWDGTDWSQLSGDIQPEFQTEWAMASGPNTGVVLVYPGGVLTSTHQELFATYRWSSPGWTKVDAAGPVRRIWPGLTYDPDLGKLLMFGGTLSEVGPSATDMWTWDGATWTQLSPTGQHPSGGIGSMTYDAARKQIVWVGADGTWSFDGHAWTQRASAAQSPPYGNWGTLTFDEVHAQVLLTGMLTGSGFGRTYVWDGVSWTEPSADLASPSLCPLTSSSADPTTAWAPLSNKGGRFSLRYPCGWGSRNCDGTQLSSNAALGPDFIDATNSCFWGEGPTTVEVFSSAPNGQMGGVNVGDITGTTSVTADGVRGTRQTAIVTADNPIPPVKGATQIVYTFKTGGTTYIVYYTREPGQPDFTTDVDNLVERTLKFSA